MVGATRKRKAPSDLEESTKRQRTEEAASPEPHFGSDEDDDCDEYQDEAENFSEAENTADTPATPFSPRKKFPSELKTLKCTFAGCTKTFNRPVRLETHMKTHTNERTFICTYEGCDKAYFEDKHLQAHIKGSHTHERKHECTWEGCTKSFLTGTRLRRHIATHEGHERFRCTSYLPCNETFRKHQTLQRHIRSVHLELAPFPCTFVDPVTNEPCGAGFDGASGLRRHEEVTHGPAQFFCANCVIPDAVIPDGTPVHPGFTTNSQLQSHIRKEHANSTCMFCDKECSNERQLQSHIESQHSGTTLEERKNVPCTYIGCDRTFTKKSNLNTHIRTAHMGERYICGDLDTSESKGLEEFDPEEGCGKDFVSKQFLEDHIRVVHLGLKSIINAKRPKRVRAAELDDFLDDEKIEGPRPRKKRKGKKRVSAISRLMGDNTGFGSASHAEAPITLRSGRQLNEFTDFEAPSAQQEWSQIPDPQMPIEGAMQYPLGPLDEIDWELQQQAIQGGPFWIGGGDDENDGDYDPWARDEEEMRRLIG